MTVLLVGPLIAKQFFTSLRLVLRQNSYFLEIYFNKPVVLMRSEKQNAFCKTNCIKKAVAGVSFFLGSISRTEHPLLGKHISIIRRSCCHLSTCQLAFAHIKNEILAAAFYLQAHRHVNL